MKKILLLILLVMVQAIFTRLYAFDWKAIHDKADGLSLDKALAASGSLEGKYALGLVYLDLRKDKDAQAVFADIVKVNPDSTGGRWGLAEVLRRQHRLDDAEVICNDLLLKDPDFVPAYITLAYIKYLRMDFKGSVSLATKVIRMGREKSDLTNLARAYSLLGGANGMIAHYSGPISKLINGSQVMSNLRRAEQIRPGSPAVLFGFGSFYLLAPAIIGGDLDKSLDYLEKAKDKDPLFADIYVRLAQAYKLKGDRIKYNEYLNKALEIDPGNELALDTKSGECKYVCSP